MQRKRTKPLVGIPCDHRMIGPHPFHAVGEKYIVAVRDGADAIPILIPVLQNPLEIDDLIQSVDGIFLTGSPSNVSPSLYGGTTPRTGVLQDERRDTTTIPLIKQIVARSLPVFAVCRGFQEFNVAFDGTLHQHLEEVPGRFDHREDKNAALDVQYAPSHDVFFPTGGMLEKITGKKSQVVNSLHGQGIDRLGNGLTIEATAQDGTIEAISVARANNFTLGVQWHPEWKFWEDEFSRTLFNEFGRALRK